MRLHASSPAQWWFNLRMACEWRLQNTDQIPSLPRLKSANSLSLDTAENATPYLLDSVHMTRLPPRQFYFQLFCRVLTHQPHWPAFLPQNKSYSCFEALHMLFPLSGLPFPHFGTAISFSLWRSQLNYGGLWSPNLRRSLKFPWWWELSLLFISGYQHLAQYMTHSW